MLPRPLELRGTKSNKDGDRMGLICSGTGLVWGECTFDHCQGPLNAAELLDLQPKHHVHANDDRPDTAHELRARIKYKTCYGWHLKDVKLYETGVPYEHPRGAIGWIDLTKSVAGHGNAQRAAAAPQRQPARSPPHPRERAQVSPPKKPRITHVGKSTSRPKSKRCGACEGCQAPECGTCRCCLNKTKFGGTGTLKKPCEAKICRNPIRSEESPIPPSGETD